MMELDLIFALLALFAAANAAYRVWVGVAARSDALPLSLTPRNLRGGNDVQFRQYSWRNLGRAGRSALSSTLWGGLALNYRSGPAPDLNEVTAPVVLVIFALASMVGWTIYCFVKASSAR